MGKSVNNVNRCLLCSYSRRIVWLEAGVTNNDPAVVTSYYLECARKLKGGIMNIKALMKSVSEIGIYICFVFHSHVSGPRLFTLIMALLQLS